jgi:predicted ATPase/class 3 adenylate cyclase
MADSALPLPSGTVTFLLTDVEGSTALWEQAPEPMRIALARHDTLFEGAVAQHSGVHIRPRGEGDSRFTVFGSAPDAIAAALAIQRALAGEPWPTPRPIAVRIGIHTGEAELRDRDYYGSAVNRCARLRNIGHGGQILLSESTATLSRGFLSAGVSLLHLGQHRLKDLTQPEHVFQVVASDLASKFPALVSLDTRPHNLPIHPTALLGREREVAELTRLLRGNARLVTLTGPGGIGKTRLSVQVAADLLEDFEHGVFLIELAPISDHALVPATIAQVLGLRELGDRSMLDGLTDYLRSRRILLLLDNLEQILAVAPVLASLMVASAGLSMLVTSREPLRVRGEHEYAVPPLALPTSDGAPTPDTLIQSAAVSLFLERAMAIRSDFILTSENASAIAEICTRLDDYERRLFRRLSIFVGGWTLEAAEAVCDSDDDSIGIQERLEMLVSKSLVRQGGIDIGGEPRFSMLETIREFAGELSTHDETAATRSRHVRFFLQLATTGDGRLRRADQAEWLARLEREHENFRAALEWSRTTAGLEGVTLELAGTLSWFWFLHGHFSEGRRWLESALAENPHAPARLRARTMNGAGNLAWGQGDFERAELLHQEALGLLREVGDVGGMAFTLGRLGHIPQYQGDYDRAAKLYEESLQLFRQVGDVWGVPSALYWLGAVAYEQGHISRAKVFFEEGLTLYRRTGDRRGMAYQLRGLGRVAISQGDTAAAMTLLTESVSLFRSLGDKLGTTWSLHSLGEAALIVGDVRQADAYFKHGLDLHRQTGNKQGASECLGGVARVAMTSGDLPRAAHLFAASSGLREAMGARARTSNYAETAGDLSTLRTGLGDEVFASIWKVGSRMDFEQAIAYALEENVA